MCLIVTQQAPDFTAKAVMPDNTFKDDFKLSDYRGKYVILFFYPLDFTFVCPSEIIAFDKRLAEFKERNCEIIAASTDSHHSHWAWKMTPPEKGGIGNVQYPIVSDFTKEITSAYGVLDANAVPLRGLFLIDKDGIVRSAVVNDDPIGRSVDEAIRVVDALQHFEAHGQVCPANWHKGDEAITKSAEGVAKYLAEHA